MIRLVKVLLGLVIFILVVGIILAVYENINSGPWYTYETFTGEQAVIGTESSGRIPDWIKITDTVLTPFLKIGHLITDVFF
jgi:hypothetical protein